jgi:hypothetical protein
LFSYPHDKHFKEEEEIFSCLHLFLNFSAMLFEVTNGQIAQLPVGLLARTLTVICQEGRVSVTVTVPCTINRLAFLKVNKLFKELIVIIDSLYVSLPFLNKLQVS